jgi:hypothetical protein
MAEGTVVEDKVDNAAATAPAADAPAPAAAAPAATAPAAAAAAPAATAGAPAKADTPADPGNAAAAAPAKGAWPEDWATRMSKGDQKRAKDLSRYASPEALADAYINLRTRQDSGEFKAVLPKNAKPEEIAAWRKDNGIPEKAEGYDLAGIQVPAKDKDIIGGFLNRLHKANATPEVAREAIAAYYAQAEHSANMRAERDEQQRTQALDALNTEWGAQFRRNLNLIEGTILSRFPADVRDLIKSARFPDGTALFNSPSTIRALVALANEINPAGIIVPGGTGEIGKTLTDEWKAIQKVRTENRGAYNKDDAMQKRERELIDAMIKHGFMNESGQLIERKAA